MGISADKIRWGERDNVTPKVEVHSLIDAVYVAKLIEKWQYYKWFEFIQLPEGNTVLVSRGQSYDKLKAKSFDLPNIHLPMCWTKAVACKWWAPGLVVTGFTAVYSISWTSFLNVICLLLLFAQFVFFPYTLGVWSLYTRMLKSRNTSNTFILKRLKPLLLLHKPWPSLHDALV